MPNSAEDFTRVSTVQRHCRYGSTFVRLGIHPGTYVLTECVQQQNRIESRSVCGAVLRYGTHLRSAGMATTCVLPQLVGVPRVRLN